MLSCLVTGGAGFIGSHIAEALAKKGASVTILDNLSSGKIENISDFIKSVKFIEGDIRNPSDIEKSLDGIEVVFHQAAIPSVVKSFENPVETFDVNVTGTLKLLEACRKKGVSKIIFASSSSVYGDSPSLPKHELMPIEPKSPYAISKMTCEVLLKLYCQNFGMEGVSLRYFNAFGPRQNPDSEYAAVIPKFITSLLTKKSPVIFGDGQQTRDFCYIHNVVNANLLSMEKSGLHGEVINVATAERYSLLKLLEILSKITGEYLQPVFAPERPGDIKHSLASIERACSLLNYTVEVNFEKGLEKTVEYFRKKLRELNKK